MTMLRNCRLFRFTVDVVKGSGADERHEPYAIAVVATSHVIAFAIMENHAALIRAQSTGIGVSFQFNGEADAPMVMPEMPGDTTRKLFKYHMVYDTSAMQHDDISGSSHMENFHTDREVSVVANSNVVAVAMVNARFNTRTSRTRNWKLDLIEHADAPLIAVPLAE